MIENLSKIIGKKINRLFLVVWPPYGEDDFSQVDISAGYVFDDNPNELLIISTEKDDLTTPTVEYHSIPKKCFLWLEFDDRIKSWMACDNEMIIETEFYELSKEDNFQNIVNQEVLDIEIVKFVDGEPIGVKLIFKDDFVLSTPINDGNTIETTSFNQNDNIKNFSSLGNVEFVSIKKRIR